MDSEKPTADGIGMQTESDKCAVFCHGGGGRSGGFWAVPKEDAAQIETERDESKALLSEWNNAARHVEAGHPDEAHCGCVSVFRKLLTDAQRERDDAIENSIKHRARVVELEMVLEDAKQKSLSAEFRLRQEELVNFGHEEDYLAVCKLIKEPSESVVDAVKRVIRERDNALMERDAAHRAVQKAVGSFVEKVERRAEEKMLKTGKLEGAHYAAMKQLQAEMEETKGDLK